ncbi:hypothetical protein L6452_44447 [Arctium lappa]|uniref:Uncharacterized protein n=1 Tax=Arctium lappa TaxID=4217 RepID=A0ACB8XF43_ARCLA|nr:hypothetical protein L6452_44447 [Arctium lappa]
MTIHGSRNIFTYVLHILLLSSIILIMMMINHCHGFPSSSFNYKYAPDHCNGTLAECPTSLLEEEDSGEEFLMDTEEHRRILQGQKRYISNDGLQRAPVGCGNYCAGFRFKNVGHRKCTTEFHCEH